MIIKLLEPLRVSDAYIEELAQPLKDAGHEFVYYKEKTTDPAELAERSKDADIVIIANNPYPKEAFEHAENLKLIDIAFTGINHVDTDAAKAQGIQVANAAGYSRHSVPELSLTFALALFRQAIQSDADTRKAKDFQGPIQGREIYGKTVGIVGLGDLGSRTARLYKGVGANVIAYNRSDKSELAEELGIELVSLDELAERSDIISVHLAQTPETTGLIDKDFIAKMKKDAILLNIARGPIVDSQALADALNNDEIGGAGIDVFEMEPPIPADHPLLNAKHTVLAPHIGFLTDEAMVDRAQIVFQNAQSFIDGKPENIMDI